MEAQCHQLSSSRGARIRLNGSRITLQMHREWLVNYIGQKLLTSLSRLGYSKKGWTTGEIGIEWIKIFDKQTCTKADGEYRMLLVDGHNSHYTHTFLQYARKHKIIVLCYPAHTTHVYQGLDVVIFAVLKRYIGKECQAYEQRTGEKMKKENFLEIYSKAHQQAMQPDGLLEAWDVASKPRRYHTRYDGPK